MFKLMIVAALALPLAGFAADENELFCQKFAGKIARNAAATALGKACETESPKYEDARLETYGLKPLAATDDGRQEKYEVHVANFTIWFVKVGHYVSRDGKHFCHFTSMEESNLEGVH